MLKRFLAFALCCVMILSFVPATVFAVGGDLNAIPIEVGVEATAVIEEKYGCACFSFTPECTESYTFYSIDRYDTRVFLYDSNMELLNEYMDADFKLTWTLEAGKTYFFETNYRGYYTGSFQVMLKVAHSWSKESICIHCGESLNESGTYGENITWSVDKEGILTIFGEGKMEKIPVTPWEHLEPFIKEIVIEDGVTRIPVSPFVGCNWATTISIPDSLQYIDLTLGNNLKEFVVSEGNEVYSSIDGVLFSKDKTSLLYYPKGRAGDYTIPEGTVTIESSAFSSREKLRNVIIPDSVTVIKKYAFHDTSNLKTVQLGKSVSSIGAFAFGGTSIASVVFTGNAPSFDENAFGSGIATVHYPENDDTWTPDKLRDYGGVIRWVCADANEMPPAEPLTVGKEYTVTIEESGAWVYFTFTPEVSALYDFSATGDVDTACILYDSSMHQLVASRYTGYEVDVFDEDFSIKRVLEAGESYVFCVRTENGETGSFPVALNVFKTQFITVNKKSTVTIETKGEYVYIPFTPEYTDVYTFYARRRDVDCNLHNRILDTIKNTEYDKEGVHVTCRLEKDYTYYYGTTTNSMSDDRESVSYEVVLEVTHEGEALNTIPATCTEDGLKACVCDYCGEEFTEVIPAAGHDWNKESVCTVCGKELPGGGTCGENLTWTLNKEGVLTITGSGAMHDYTFPYIDDDTNPGLVSTGAAPWTKYTSLITEVVIGKNVTTVGTYAFYGCSNLTKVKIGGKVERIGAAAFQQCGKLTSISIPAKVKKVGENAFSHSGIENILVDAANTAFTSVDGVLFTKNKATLICYPSGRGGVYTVPVGTKIIEDCAFMVNTKLSGVVIADSVTNIGDSAFFGCYGIETLQLGKSVTTIGNYAFQMCDNLKELTIPDSVTTIGEAAFNACSNLETLQLGTAVKSIGDHAFSYCETLEEVLIPASVTTIGAYAFSENEMMASVVFTGKAPAIGNRAFGNVTAMVRYPGDDDSWTADKKQDYGGTLTWISDSPSAITVSAGSANQAYLVGDSFNKNGVTVVASYDDGTQAVVPISQCNVTMPDMTTPGRKAVVVSYGGLSGSFEICVHNGEMKLLNADEYPESTHDYSNKWDQTWTVTIPGAEQLVLVFSDGTFTQDECDFIYVYDGNNAEIGCFTGDQAAGRRVVVSGDTAYVRLTSDGSITGYGFSFSSISGIVLEHPAAGIEIHEPTCVEDGWIPTYTCTICGKEVEKQILPALGHRFEGGVCTVCGKKDELASGVSGDLSWVLSRDGVLTFTGDGAMADYSSETHAPWNEYADKITQIFLLGDVTIIGNYAFCNLSNVNWAVIPDTVTEVGKYALPANDDLIVCFLGNGFRNPDNQPISSCLITAYYAKGNTTWTEDIQSTFGSGIIWREVQCDHGLEHTVVTDKAVAATCTEIGLTEGRHCSSCGEILVAQEKIAALGHEEVIDEAVAATCTKTGLTEGKHCSVCKEILAAQKVIDALDHEEVIDEGTAATCTEAGMSEGRHCVVCGEVLVAQEVIPAAHKEEIIPGTKPTCTETGLTDGKKCSICGETLVEQKTIKVTKHSCTKVSVKQATLEKNGYKAHYQCDVCKKWFKDSSGKTEVKKETYRIPAIKTVRLSSACYSYDGDTKRPAAGVYDTEGNKLDKDKDYTITYAKGREAVGTYNVTIKGIGNYSFRKTLTFEIIPPKSKITDLTGKSKAFTVTWSKKTSQVKGYQIQYTLDEDFEDGIETVTIKDNGTTSKTIKGLKAGKVYYVRIRTYKNVDGKNYYSNWTDPMGVKTK